eukprot:CAMPEP_0197320232 /NCGR_PEP_ID=MMETSP0891-20130614/58398_1 /TAXON_ID=44058 ORGANISM="Aureoumbra lagunensis, Strain CCMP1510" /NCGR_SAMPLE_ID=MMETSP0891 /ASSEMBLY_ACC=CAM_ASM_000534 /LENGTH=610 /DNA_ID=CAMNT_0042811507 /DNA_START=1419 /DNA_END=3252 /DNA_ORIENTATION=+
MSAEIQLNPLHREDESTRVEESNEERTLEEAIEAAIEASGFGKYQKIVCIISGLLWAADSMEVSLLSFLYECAGASLNLTSAQAASIVSVVFAGELCGASIAGPLADAYGRRPVSVGAAGLVAIFGLFTALAPNLWTLLFCRFVVGIAVGGLAVPFDLLSEFLPKSARGGQLTAIEFAWAFGAIYATGAAWLTLRTHSWRLLVLVCGLPFVFVFAAMIIFVDESPRWLAQAGQVDRLAIVLSRLDRVNNSHKASSRTKNLDSPLVAAAIKASSKSTRRRTANHEKTGIEAFRDIPTLLTRKDLRYITLTLWIVWLGFGLVFYGISLLATRIFNNSSSDGFSCDFNYGFVLGISTSQIFGVAVLLFLIDRLGRRRSQAWPYALTALALLPVPILNQNNQKISVFACLYLALGSVMCASSASWVHVAELYPTDVRSTGHSIVLTVSRLSAFSTSYLVDSDFSISTVCAVLTAVSLLASLASAALPETHNENSIAHQLPRVVNNNDAEAKDEHQTDQGSSAENGTPFTDEEPSIELTQGRLKKKLSGEQFSSPYHSLSPASPPPSSSSHRNHIVISATATATDVDNEINTANDDHVSILLTSVHDTFQEGRGC